MAKTNTTTEEVKKDSALAAEKAVEAKGTKSQKRKLSEGILHIEATFNNTKVLFADKGGNTLFWSSSGSLGFKGAKKGTKLHQ